MAVDAVPAPVGLARWYAAVRWYVRALLGEDAYERYREHHIRLHPGEPLLGEREFWRARQDEQEVRPGQRCC